MYKFKTVVAQRTTSNFQNIEYIPEILELFNSYKNYLSDDYYSSDNVDYFLEKIDLINSLYPHFYAIITQNNQREEFLGFVYLEDFKGSLKQIHSCKITTCFKRAYWGDHPQEAAKSFLAKLFNDLKIKKLKAEVFSFNSCVKNFLHRLGFRREACLKNESLKHQKPLDILIYSLLAEDYLKNERNSYEQNKIGK